MHFFLPNTIKTPQCQWFGENKVLKDRWENESLLSFENAWTLHKSTMPVLTFLAASILGYESVRFEMASSNLPSEEYVLPNI